MGQSSCRENWELVSAILFVVLFILVGYYCAMWGARTANKMHTSLADSEEVGVGRVAAAFFGEPANNAAPASSDKPSCLESLRDGGTVQYGLFLAGLLIIFGSLLAIQYSIGKNRISELRLL